MTAIVPLQKAELHQLDAKLKSEINPDKNAKLQFNPESLKLSFANQIQTPAGSAAGSRQFVGSGTTKLSLSVYFDASAPPAEGEAQVDDVRQLTQKVVYFITPEEKDGQFIPPAVRFVWGSFQFDGMVDSLEENLEFFSSAGKPLRASMTLSLSQQRILVAELTGGVGLPGLGGLPSVPGTQPLTQAPAGASLQSLAAQAGLGDNWQAIASANGIENPRQLVPGQFLNLNPASAFGRQE